MGGHLGIIRASRDHPGGPWEQQDGLEVVDNMIFDDFGVTLALAYITFWVSKCLKMFFVCRACFQVIFLSISDSNFRRLGLPHQSFRMGKYWENRFSMGNVFNKFGDRSYPVFNALMAAFLVFCIRNTTQRVLVI